MRADHYHLRPRLGRRRFAYLGGPTRPCTRMNLAYARH
jgi:hypothetical protein